MLTEVISGQVIIFFPPLSIFIYLKFSKIKIDCLIGKKHIFKKEKQKESRTVSPQELIPCPSLSPCLSKSKLRAAGPGALGWKVPRPPTPTPRHHQHHHCQTLHLTLGVKWLLWPTKWPLLIFLSATGLAKRPIFTCQK